MITVNGVSYRICGYLDEHRLVLAVMDDARDIGQVLIRDSLDSPWRLRISGGGA